MSEKQQIVDAVVDAVAKPPGKGRDPYSYDGNRDSRFGEFFGFSNDRDVFSFDASGQPLVRRLRFLQEPERSGGKNSQIRAHQFMLPIPYGSEKYLPLPVGLTLISGATAVGKSTFVRALGRIVPHIERLLAVEPHDRGDEIESVRAFSTADSALAAAVLEAHTRPQELRVIDSLRAPLFETTGPASTKGVIMPFFTQLTRVSMTLARSGISVMATVNPMDDDPAFVRGFLSKLSASVPCTIFLESYNKVGLTETFTGTIQARPSRKSIAFTFSTGDAASVKASDLIDDIVMTPVALSRDVGPTPNAVINSLSKDTI